MSDENMQIARRTVLAYGMGVVSFLGAARVSTAHAAPRMFLGNLTALRAARRAWRAGHSAAQRAITALINTAEEALRRGPYTVLTKTVIPPSGDRHDYLDRNHHFWPNSRSTDGLPWVQQGEAINPEAYIDARALHALARDVRAGGIAAFVTQREKYAAHTAWVVRAWFLEAETRMTPHALFGNIIPGVRAESFPVARMASEFVELIDSLGLLEATAAWTRQDQQGMQRWARQFVTWMETHPSAVEQQAHHNNHGTYYDLLAALLWAYSGETQRARGHILHYAERIAEQFAGDGSQPHEMWRTDNLFYHAFNLSGALHIAALAQQVAPDLDLFHLVTGQGSSLQQGLEFLLPYATDTTAWPFFPGEKRPIPRSLMYRVYHRAAGYDQDQRYWAAAQAVRGDWEALDVQLLYPRGEEETQANRL